MLDIEDKLILLAKEVSTLKKQTTSLSTATETITKLEGPQGIQGPKGEQGDRGADGVNGKDGVDGRDGKDGDKGADGVSVIDATVDFDNSLVLKLSNGSEIDAGQINVVAGPDGITQITSRQTVSGDVGPIDSLSFNLADATPATGIGVVHWNDTDGTLEFGLKGGNVNLQIGQEAVHRVLNHNTGSTFLNGRVGKVIGAQGNRVSVDYALADSDTNSMTVLGVFTEDIPNNQEGYITTEGLVRNIDTSAYPEGSVLWLSPTTPGLITATKPSAPDHLVMIGYCVRSHPTVGTILVKVQNGYELDELHNVLITTPTDGQVLTYDGTSQIWVNETPSSGGAVSSVNGFTGAVVLTASDVGAATTAQGTLASTALQPAAIGVSVQGYNANTVIDSSYVHTDNNYTTAEKSKLSGIAAGAEVNVNADWSAVSGDAQILNKPSLATVATTGAYSDLSGLPTIPAQFNPIAGTNVTLSGTYPNITFNASGGGGGGGGTAATATIDLGATPVSESSVTVTDASITSTSYIQVFVMVDSTADNTTEDHRHAAASWQMSALPNSGSFTLYINSMMDLCWGTFKIRYTLV